MRSMTASLIQSIDKVSEVDRKISYEALIGKFYNTYQLCNKDLNKFALLLRKGVYPYEYMDSWKRFKEESLPDKESFYSELNKEHITDEDYAHAQKVWNTFNIKNLGEYHDLYVQSDTALLADVFDNFRDKCIEIYRVDPAHFLTAPGLAWQACLKKTEVELELLTDNDMLNMFEKGIRGGMCQASYRYVKANNKYMKNYDKNKESSFLIYDDANNLYGFAMCKKLPVSDFKWVDDLSIFTEDFIKNYDEESDIGYLFVVDVEYPKNLHMLHSDLPFLPERMKIIKCTKLVCNLNDKENYPYHSTEYISKDLLIMEMKKTKVKINKLVYFGQAILDISKTLMHEFWYDYIKPMYGDKARLCYMDTDSLILINIKTDDFYKILIMM